MKTTHSEAQHWWSNLSTGERRLICALARMLKNAKPNSDAFCRKRITQIAPRPDFPSPHPMGRGIKGEGAVTVRQPKSPRLHPAAAPGPHRAYRSPLKDLTRAISNWERGTGCFIKIRIIHQRPLRLAPHGPWLRIEGKRINQLKKAA